MLRFSFAQSLAEQLDEALHFASFPEEVEAGGWKDGQAQRARVSITAGSDYGATALGVVGMAKLLLNGEVAASGVYHPAQIFALQPLLETMETDEVELFEQLGT